MSDINTARKSSVRIIFDGTDITDDIMPYFLSLSYTDCEEDETDDLSLTLQDRDGVWLSSWLASAIDAAASERKIRAYIIRHNWLGDGVDEELPCGEFQLDSVDVSGPPSVVTMRATSLPYDSTIRQTKKNKAWEAYDLAGIANEMAANAGLTVDFQSSRNPSYKRVEQFNESDIAFLSVLCHNSGLSLKSTDGQIVIFDQAEYEAADAVTSVTFGDGSYIKFKLSTGEADAQYSSCVVKYTDSNGKFVTATVTDTTAKNEQSLVVAAKVGTSSEAVEYARQQLRLKNKFEMLAAFTFHGNPMLCAGMTITLNDFGAWDGKYIIKQAVHSVSSTGGYTTQVTLRKALGDYT